MHKWAKSMAECLKAEVESIGKNNLSSEQICDIKNWSEIIKNITCYEKDYKIIEAMEKSGDDEKILEMMEKYDDDPERRFYNNNRYMNGRYAPKGYRRNYEERMMPEYERDMDMKRGRMYYTEMPTNAMGDGSVKMYTQPSYSRMENARRNFEEHMAKGDKSEVGKKKEMELVTELIDAATAVMMHHKKDMSNEAKTAVSQKLSNFSNEVMR